MFSERTSGSTIYNSLAQIRSVRNSTAWLSTGDNPVELLSFVEEGRYWPELRRCYGLGRDETFFGTLYICWGGAGWIALSLMAYPSINLPHKMFGVFPPPRPGALQQTQCVASDDVFMAPHSRHKPEGSPVPTSNRCQDLVIPWPKITDQAWQFILPLSQDGRHTFRSPATRNTIRSRSKANMNRRTWAKGFQLNIPANYFPGDDPSPTLHWCAGEATPTWLFAKLAELLRIPAFTP